MTSPSNARNGHPYNCQADEDRAIIIQLLSEISKKLSTLTPDPPAPQLRAVAEPPRRRARRKAGDAQS